MEPKTIVLPKTLIYQFEIALYAITFSVPLLIAGPQWLTGTIVNYILFVYSISFPKKNIIPIAVLPSIAALGHGVIFGAFTPFLLYFLPFIWLGNIVLMKLFQFLVHKMPVSIAILMSSFIKVAILSFAASVYFQFNIVPRLFLSSMGVMQFYTALAGGLLTLVTIKIFNKKYD